MYWNTDNNSNEKEIVVKAGDASRDYNGQALTQPDYEMISGQLASGDYIDKVTMTADSTITNAGTQTNVIESIVIRNEAGEDVTGNYSNITKQNGTLTVNKVSVTVTADNKTKKYGEANPELTYTESGFVNSETLNSLGIAPELSTTATVTSTAGGYPITFVEPTTSTTNYNITYNPGTLTVTETGPRDCDKGRGREQGLQWPGADAARL